MTIVRVNPLGLVVLLVLAGLMGSPFVYGQLVGDATAPATSDAPSEPDYAKVAEDARKIADEIDERLIDTHMTDAREGLFATDGIVGHLRSEEAYVDMEEMISFCESTAGKAGAACEFKLQIKMSLNPGNTLGQLSKGMSPGTGFFGNTGQGAGGQTGSAANFGVFGPESFGDQSRASRFLSERKSNARSANEGPGSLAGNVEEVSTIKKDDINFSAESEGRVMEEYRALIETYFKRIAEEDNGS